MTKFLALLTKIKLRPLGVLLSALLMTAPVLAEDPPAAIRFGEVGGNHIKSIAGKPAGVDVVALAQHLGLFEREFGAKTPKIEEIFFSGTGPAQNEALAQGVIDFGFYGGVPNVIGLIGNIPAKIVLARHLGAASQFRLAVRPDSPIQSVRDLKGKRIAVQKGTNPHQTLVLLLESKGLSERDVRLTNLQGAEGLVALQAGAVDATFGGVNLLILRDQKQLRILDESVDFDQGPIQGGMLVTDRFAKRYPETTTRVLKVLLQASHWASQESNREALLQFVSARSLSYEYVKEDYAGSLLARFNPLIDDSTFAAYREISRFCVEHGLTRKDADEATVRSWFRPEFQQAALRELKLENYWPRSDGKAARRKVP